MATNRHDGRAIINAETPGVRHGVPLLGDIPFNQPSQQADEKVIRRDVAVGLPRRLCRFQRRMEAQAAPYVLYS